jgi:polyisoprenoid-binding protein YceI
LKLSKNGLTKEQEIKLIFIFLIIFYAANIFAKNCVIDSSNSFTEFIATGKPAMIKITGRSEKLEGALDFSKTLDLGSVQIDLNSFETGMDTRNEHMKEKYLEVNKNNFKTSVFKLSKIENNTFSGKILLHGVEKDITGKAEVKLSDKACGAKATFNLKMSDFAIETPNYLGVTVAEEVNVTVELKGNIL